MIVFHRGCEWCRILQARYAYARAKGAARGRWQATPEGVFTYF
jgi:hypothetical protein